MAPSIVLRVHKGDAHAPRTPEDAVDTHDGRIRDIGTVGAAPDDGASARAARADRSRVYDGRAGHGRRARRAGDTADGGAVAPPLQRGAFGRLAGGAAPRPAAH